MLVCLSFACPAHFRVLIRWGPGKHATHTVHVEDVAGALFACAEWMARLGREKALAAGGEDIICLGDKKRLKELQSKVELLTDPDKTVRAPSFNIVSCLLPATTQFIDSSLSSIQEDDSNSTMTSLGNLFTSVFDTTFEYYNVLVNQMAKVR